MGDGCGAHMIIRYNTYLSPGMTGIGIACGTDIHITDNIVYGKMRPGSNVGISIWNQYSGECSGNEIARNQVRWCWLRWHRESILECRELRTGSRGIDKQLARQSRLDAIGSKAISKSVERSSRNLRAVL